MTCSTAPNTSPVIPPILRTASAPTATATATSSGGERSDPPAGRDSGDRHATDDAERPPAGVTTRSRSRHRGRRRSPTGTSPSPRRRPIGRACERRRDPRTRQPAPATRRTGSARRSCCTAPPRRSCRATDRSRICRRCSRVQPPPNASAVSASPSSWNAPVISTPATIATAAATAIGTSSASPAATPPTARPIKPPTSGNHGTHRVSSWWFGEPDRDAGEELDRAQQAVHCHLFSVGRSLAEPLPERRDLGDAGARHRHQRHRRHRAAALAEAHVEVEQRSLAETLQQLAVARARPSSGRRCSDRAPPG